MGRFLKVRNQSGFTMIEVLAAAGAAAVVVFGTMKMASDMARTSVVAESSQQRTNLGQDLTTVFANPDNCSRVLSGTASVNGTAVNLNSLGAMNSTVATNSSSSEVADKIPVLDRVAIKSLILTNVSGDLGSGNYRAILVLNGNMSDSQKGTGGSTPSGVFRSTIPIYYKVSGGVIASCLTTKSAYATCLAMKGTWNGTICDFCSALGGVRQADGRCSIAKATPPPPPPPPPATDGSSIVSVMGRSLYNGYNDQSLGTHKWCALTNFAYDGDGIGECTLTGGLNGNWNLHMGDEGTASPQLCYVTCSDGGSSSITGNRNDGALCNVGGFPGIYLGGCCATGNQFQILFRNAGKGGVVVTGRINNILCR
jgi:hypothetical protein